jgi:streptogramin lyase
MCTRRLLPLLASAVALLACPGTAAAGITEFTTSLTPGGAPVDITTGPDGNLWFTEQGGLGGIGKITTDGAITEYTAGLTPGFSIGQMPSHITAGPDGALWFTAEGGAGLIGRLDPETGEVTEYCVNLTPNQQPTGIALGPDGNLWFTERGGDGAIGRITPSGEITEYTTGLTPGGEPTDIVAGPDGNLWFTLSANPGGVGRIDPDSGDITEFRNGLTTGSGPSHIVEHSNGRLYFTETNDPGAIARIKTSGHINEYTDDLTPDQRPTGIAEGGDGALWFTSGATPGRIGRFSPDTKAITELTGGVALDLTPGSDPSGITRGPDGNVWFTQRAFPGGVGRVTVPPRAELEIEDDHGGSGQNRHEEHGVLEATITANSQATTYHVSYGPTTSYGSASAELPAGAGAGRVEREVDLPLGPGGPYHARVVATNGSGEASSDDLTFWVKANGDISASGPAPTTTATPTSTPAPAADPAPDTPAVTPATGHAPAPPRLGHGVVIRPVSGAVRFKAPGASGYSALGGGVNLPVGSLVDTRRGRVSLQSARDTHGRTQTGTFWGGVFQVRQRRHGRGVTDIVLRNGNFSRCGAVAGTSALAREAGGKRRVVRRLWGKDRHARFRTHGRDSVATVRGTKWVTTDRCDGTLTKVSEGKVLVRDLHRKRNVLLTAGRAYLARHDRR